MAQNWGTAEQDWAFLVKHPLPTARKWVSSPQL
jgi:hypothetical protein